MLPRKLVGLAAFPLLLMSCASDKRNHSSPAVAEQRDREVEEDDGSTPPRIGMTREQVRAKYGQPVNVSVSSRGEVWSYVFNNFDGRAFIPYYGGFHQAMKKRNSSVIFFGQNGRVRDFTWNETNPRGASVWR